MDFSQFSIPLDRVILFHETLSSYSFTLTGYETVTPLANEGERWEIFTSIPDTISELQLIVSEYSIKYPSHAVAILMSMVLSNSAISITVGDELRVATPISTLLPSNKYTIT